MRRIGLVVKFGLVAAIGMLVPHPAQALDLGGATKVADLLKLGDHSKVGVFEGLFFDISTQEDGVHVCLKSATAVDELVKGLPVAKLFAKVNTGGSEQCLVLHPLSPDGICNGAVDASVNVGTSVTKKTHVDVSVTCDPLCVDLGVTTKIGAYVSTEICLGE